MLTILHYCACAMVFMIAHFLCWRQVVNLSPFCAVVLHLLAVSRMFYLIFWFDVLREECLVQCV
jgi:hypothetical protein